MDLNDFLGGPSTRPVHPDMDRVMEIVLEMKAVTAEHLGNEAGHFAAWRTEIERTIDFDVLAYQAQQVAFSIFGIETYEQFEAIKHDAATWGMFVTVCQGFYDGFLLGARFTERGGHRDAPPSGPLDGVHRTDGDLS